MTTPPKGGSLAIRISVSLLVSRQSDETRHSNTGHETAASNSRGDEPDKLARSGSTDLCLGLRGRFGFRVMVGVENKFTLMTGADPHTLHHHWSIKMLLSLEDAKTPICISSCTASLMQFAKEQLNVVSTGPTPCDFGDLSP